MMRLTKRQRRFRLYLCYTVAHFQVVGNTFQAFAQSNPGLSYGQIPTAAQWNSYFSNKTDFPAGNSSLSNMQGNTIKGNNTTGAAAPVDLSIAQIRSMFSLPILVTDPAYGAICDGVTDDTGHINTALASASIGQTVLLPFGKTCKVNAGLVIGNGGSATASTVNGVILGCQANPLSTSYFGGMSKTAGCRLTFGGGNASIVNILGPIQGWGVENLYLDCTTQGTAPGLGVKVVSGQGGFMRNVVVDGCAQAIDFETVPQGGVFGDSNTEQNVVINATIIMPANIPGGSIGYRLTGQTTDTTSDSTQNTIIGSRILVPQVAGTFSPVVLQGADANTFIGVQIFGGSTGCQAISFDYTQHNAFPASNVLSTVDPGSGCATSFGNSGSPGSSAKPNYIFGLVEANGAAAPTLANLAVYGSHDIVMSSGSATPDGHITQDLAGHIGFKGNSPTLTAGCNGAGSSVTGNDNSGFAGGQTGTATTCTLTFAKPYTATPTCTVTGNTGALTGGATVTTAGIVVTFASTANFFWSYNCHSIN